MLLLGRHRSLDWWRARSIAERTRCQHGQSSIMAGVVGERLCNTPPPMQRRAPRPVTPPWSDGG